MCEKENHEYSEKLCPKCGKTLCYSCCGGTNLGLPYIAEEDKYMTCPHCGEDLYLMEGK